jgi:glycosyltransferase involved in cell wall biosynthesis
VIIPTFNRGYIVGEALTSVLSQTYDDFEVLVVDDGSTDDTAGIVKGLSDSRIRYIRLEKNVGVAAATNKGLREANGEFISFLDSDDLWKPNKLECNVTYLDSHPEAQAVFSDLEKFDGSTYYSSFMRTTSVFSKLLATESYPEGIVLPQRFMYLCLLQEVPIKTPTVTIRREAVQRTGEFNEASPSGQDWEFFLRLSRFACFGYIDRPLSVVRVLGDATHRLNAERDHLFLLEVLRREATLLNADPEALAAARRGIADLTKHLAWHYLATNRRADAFKGLFQGFCGTREMGLLLRAMAIWMPDSMQGRLRTYSTKCARRESARPAESPS